MCHSQQCPLHRPTNLSTAPVFKCAFKNTHISHIKRLNSAEPLLLRIEKILSRAVSPYRTMQAETFQNVVDISVCAWSLYVWEMSGKEGETEWQKRLCTCSEKDTRKSNKNTSQDIWILSGCKAVTEWICRLLYIRWYYIVLTSHWRAKIKPYSLLKYLHKAWTVNCL